MSNNKHNKGQLDDVSDSKEKTFEGRRVRFPRKAKLRNLRRSARNCRVKDSEKTPQTSQALSSESSQALSLESSNQLKKKSKTDHLYCKYCPISVNTLKELQQHNLRHVPNTSFLCFKCFGVFDYQDELGRHLMQHNLSINFQCNSCRLQFLTKSALVKHCDVKKHDYFQAICMALSSPPTST
uniref:C2H2-type domain-containing protein n=1 Tax=Glossina brevipalpis TaxID=37001 RepID=A0A1A9WFQ2_9MUSC